MKTIYQASNDTSVLYFEDEEDARKYAASSPPSVGMQVFPVAIIQSQSINEITDLKMGDTLVSDIDFTKTEIIDPSKPDYSNHKTRPEGYYRIETAFKIDSIAYWNNGFWLCHGDEDEYSDDELNIKSVEFIAVY